MLSKSFALSKQLIYAPNETVVEKLKAITAQFENLLQKR